MSNLLGNAARQPADPSYTLPPKNTWAHSQDNALYASISATANIIFGVLILFICLILIFKFTKNPNMVTQQEGICYYRTTQILRLRTDMVQTFLRMTTESLLSYRSPEYDVSSLKNFVNTDIIQAFNNLAQKQAETRRQAARRQFWEISEIRRYYNPELPNCIGIAIRGKKTIIQRSPNREQRSPDTFASNTLVVVYLKQQPITYANPWGLILVGIQEQSDPVKAKKIWDQSIDLTNTIDLQEKPLIAPRKEFLPIPIFEKIKFYNWLRDFESAP